MVGTKEAFLQIEPLLCVRHPAKSLTCYFFFNLQTPLAPDSVV